VTRETVCREGVIGEKVWGQLSAAPATVRDMSDTSTLVVEVHLPLTADTSIAEGENPYPWIEDVTDAVAEIEESGDAFIVEEGDEFEGCYVVVITGADESTLLGLAGRLATLPGAPTGVFAMVTDDEADELGLGRRVDIS
jgi:hypothetical protein